MRVIRIDDEVFEVLQRLATPFTDTPNSVLRREFGLDDLDRTGGKNMKDSAFLFGHSPKIFPSVTDLCDFLRGDLVERGGAYHVSYKKRYQRVGAGALVAFHARRQIVGEAVVREGLKRYKGSGTSEATGTVYEADVTFEPSTVRVYDRPIPFDYAEELLGKGINPRAIQEIRREDYDNLRSRWEGAKS